MSSPFFSLVLREILTLTFFIIDSPKLIILTATIFIVLKDPSSRSLDKVLPIQRYAVSVGCHPLHTSQVSQPVDA